MKAFAHATKETKVQTSIQMVIMDAIEQGKTNKDQLIAYMKTDVFANAVDRYMTLINQ